MLDEDSDPNEILDEDMSDLMESTEENGENGLSEDLIEQDLPENVIDEALKDQSIAPAVVDDEDNECAGE